MQTVLNPPVTKGTTGYLKKALTAHSNVTLSEVSTSRKINIFIVISVKTLILNSGHSKSYLLIKYVLSYICRVTVNISPSHTKDFKTGSGVCLHVTQDEVETTKHNWSARCQYNVTGWCSMWAYDMLFQ